MTLRIITILLLLAGIAGAQAATQSVNLVVPPGSQVVVTITAAPASVVTPATQPAKMAIGANLPANDPLSANAMWCDATRAATGYYGVDGAKVAYDANGLPATVTKGNSVAEAAAWVQLFADPNGDYKATWTGPQSSFYIKGRTWKAISSDGKGGWVATVTINPVAGDTYVEFRSLGGVTNIHLMVPDDNGLTFRTPFLNLLKPFAVLRTMPLSRVNGVNFQLPNAVWANHVTSSQWDQTSREVSYELLAELCRETNTTPWVCLPYNCEDAYIVGVATIFKDFKKVYLEDGNEDWNQGPGYQGNNLRNEGKARATELGLGTGDVNQLGARYAAYLTSHMGDVWATVSSNAVTVLSCQATNPAWAHDALTYATKGKIGMLAPAPYIQPFDGFNAATSSMSDLWASCLKWETTWVIPGMNANAAEATRYGCLFGVYEGPQSLVTQNGGALPSVSFDPGNSAAQKAAFASDLMIRAQTDPGMGDLHDRNFAFSRSAGASVYCYFMIVGPWGKSGAWGDRQMLTDGENVKTQALARAVAAGN